MKPQPPTRADGVLPPPADRRFRPTIALCLGDRNALIPLLSAEGRRRGWQLVDTAYFDHELPPDIELRGAFVGALPGSELVTTLRQSGCPLVRIGSLPHPDDSELPAILPDRFAMGQVAAEHFAERGFRHVGYMGFRPWGDMRELFEGFKSTTESHGIQCHLLRDGENVPLARRVEHRRAIFTDWIREAPKPIGLLGFDDRIAARFCAWAMWAGFRVPVDIAVLGVGNRADICESSLPRISAVDPNHHARARMACDLLEQQMAGETVSHGPVSIGPAGVTARESTDVLATPDRDVATALRYMWENLDLDLSVDDIASEVGLHRRQLERAFQCELGRGINEELRRKRLETFVQLLLSTDRPISELHRRAGFRSRDYLHRVFKAEYGTTPRNYRLTQG